jgi:hypothetical protein
MLRRHYVTDRIWPESKCHVAITVICQVTKEEESQSRLLTIDKTITASQGF